MFVQNPPIISRTMFSNASNVIKSNVKNLNKYLNIIKKGNA